MKKAISILLVTLTVLCAVAVIALAALRWLYPKDYSDFVEQYAEQYGIAPELVYAIIKCESNFDKDAVSNADACGLMQITADTFEWAAKRESDSENTPASLFDPDINIRYGCAIYSILYDEFGDAAVSLAAYNAGRGRVLSWLSNEKYSADGKTLDSIPFAETQKYVDKVLNTQKIYQLIY